MKTTNRQTNTTSGMNALEKHRGWTLSVSLFSAAVALVLGFCSGYLTGFHTGYNPLLDELLADIYYTDNPVDCPPCDAGKKHEWFYVEPPLDSHLPEEAMEFPMAKQEGGDGMGP